MKKNKSVKNATYEVPAKGSLGLLAFGDKGLRAWREVRDKDKKKSEKE
jgi:hypothetical protein